MISFSSRQRYFLYVERTDMRKSFDGLSGIVTNHMDGDLLSGDVFLFINGKRDRIKLLVWDRSGFVIYYKRLESGTFELPSTTGPCGTIELRWEELVMLLEGIRLNSVKRRKRYEHPVAKGQ